LIAAFIAFGDILTVFGQPTGDSPKQNEMQVGPITITESVNGVSVSVGVTTFLSVETKPEGLFINGRVLGDFFDVQSKIGAIVDTFPLPTNNCASYSANNPVVRIWGKQLLATSNTGVLKLNGDVDLWDCRENPVPNSAVDWVEEKWLGVTVKRPKIRTWPGDPIKNKLLNQPFEASLSIAAQASGDRTAAIKLGTPDIKLGGKYVTITNGILSIAGVDINSEAAKALSKAIDPAKLQQSIPEDYAKLNPKISRVEFTDRGGHLTLVMLLSASVPADQLTDLIRLLVEKPKPQ
jgi:hypothetical protein